MKKSFKPKVDNPKNSTKQEINLKKFRLCRNDDSETSWTQDIENSRINQYRKHNIFNKLSHLSQQDKRQVSTLIYTTVNVFQEILTGESFNHLKVHQNPPLLHHYDKYELHLLLTAKQ